jgi:hypothetical protein
MFRYFSVLVFLTAFFTTGCFDVEQTLTLEKDLSGKAGFTMKIDMEPMVSLVAQLQHEMDGKKGPVTSEELEKAKADFLAKNSTGSHADIEKDKAEIRSKLPKGVNLLDCAINQQGLNVAGNLLFAFDNISKLSQITLPSKNNGSGAGPKNPVESPFAGLTVTDDDETVLLTSNILDPKSVAEKDTGGVKASADMTKLIADSFKNLRVATRITAPFEVVETNATRRDGNTLIWEFAVDDLAKMTPEQLANGIRVRYKK